MKHGALFLAPPSPPPTVFFGTKTGASGLNELAGVEDCVLAWAGADGPGPGPGEGGQDG